jgi:hypothetical protein
LSMYHCLLICQIIFVSVGTFDASVWKSLVDGSPFVVLLETSQDLESIYRFP